jgi:hypothetical protein
MLHLLSPVTAGRRWRSLLLTGILLGAVSVAWAPGLARPAVAGAIDAECVGSFSRTFSPPVSITARTVTATSTDSYNTCLVGPAGTGATVTTLTLSCVNLTAGPAETETITWQDGAGDTSTIAWSQPVISAQTVVFTGTVTAGLYTGDTAAKVTSGISYFGSVVGCLLGTPISQTTGLIDSLVLTG